MLRVSVRALRASPAKCTHASALRHAAAAAAAGEIPSDTTFATLTPEATLLVHIRQYLKKGGDLKRGSAYLNRDKAGWKTADENNADTTPEKTEPTYIESANILEPGKHCICFFCL